MNTLLLDLDNWDLCVDAAGNIAVASNPYAQAQDVASACKTFLGECYYDTTVGIPYWENVLGQLPPVSVFKEYLQDAALTVDGVEEVKCVINSFSDRSITGQVVFVNSDGVEQGVTI
jgi:hypothetical protein